LTWTESRSPVLGLLVKLFFRGIVEKWLFGIEMDKMVTNGGPQMHLQKAPLLSKDWGAPHFSKGHSFSNADKLSTMQISLIKRNHFPNPFKNSASSFSRFRLRSLIRLAGQPA